MDAYVAELARNGGTDRFRDKTGLPLTTYFSGLKIRWVLDNVPGVRDRAEAGDVLFGNIDSYLLWNLTGGPRGGLHITDCTNASRTQLMNLTRWPGTRKFWTFSGFRSKCCRRSLPAAKSTVRRPRCPERCADRRNPGRSAGGAGRPDLLPARRSQEHLWHGMFSADEYRRQARRIEIRLADHASLIGSAINRAVYALEGSIAITGALVQWMRDNFGLIRQERGYRDSGPNRQR